MSSNLNPVTAAQPPVAVEPTPAPSPWEVIYKAEFKNYNELLESKSEFRNVLSQVYRIMRVLRHMTGQEDKINGLDKEMEMQVTIVKVKNSYNTLSVLIVTCVAGGLQIAGGALGLFSVFPGTGAGDALGKIPGIGKLFSVAGAADPAKAAAELSSKISGFSTSVSSVGQGTGMIGKLFENRDEAQRTVLQFDLQQLTRKHEDRMRASNEESQQGRDATRTHGQSEAEYHNIFTRLSDTRSGG